MNNTNINDDFLTTLMDLGTKAGEYVGEALSNLIDKIIPIKED